jgi:DUF1680 family protein
MTNQPPPAFVVDTTRSPEALLLPVPLSAVRLRDDFWAPRRRANRAVTIPTQYRLLEETGRLDNFRRAAGKIGGEFHGLYFNDSDVYKWLEAAAWAVVAEPSSEITGMMDAVIAEVAAAQRPDGYLDTYYSNERAGERWTNLRDMHELYCAGHLFQGAVAHQRATGADTLSSIARRLADHICDTFGPEETGKRAGTCGHPEIEMGMVELARATGERRYLDQAQYFLDVRGRRNADGSCGVIGGRSYHQDHLPFREFDRMIGHAVRHAYLNAGAADLYAENDDATVFDALRRTWRNMTERQMYITGGIGSRYEGEAFGADFELPNARAYTETCADIAVIMWAWRMLAITRDAQYADVMELALYNGFLSGLGLDGQSYFYVNPLADDGTHRRQPWYECACCPPNIARLIASLPAYLYNTGRDGGVWVHLYAESDASLPLSDGSLVRVAQRTRMPWEGTIELEFLASRGNLPALHLRIPAWAAGATAELDGKPVDAPVTPGSYLVVRPRAGAAHVQLNLPVAVRWVESHPYAAENTDAVALLRGPLVYCAEGVDHPGVDLRDLRVSPTAAPQEAWQPDLLGGVVTLAAPAAVQSLGEAWTGTLYRQAFSAPAGSERPATLTAVPYYAWANRAAGQMQVWLRRARS